MEQSGYFRSGGHWLYGTLHTPEQGSAKAVVVFFPPFGEERKCAYRLLARLARMLASEGYGAVRFDYSGTGESAGEHHRATIGQWIADGRAARDVACEQLGCSRWIALGARLGGTLALRLAAQQNAAGVILLEPILSGAEYLRDLMRRQHIKQMMGGDDGPSPSPTEAWQTGSTVNLGGFEVGPEMARDIEQIELLPDLRRVPQNCTMQLLRVSGGKHFPPAWQPAVEVIAERGGSNARIIRDKPFWGQLEYHESDVIPGAVQDALKESAEPAPNAESPEPAPSAPKLVAEIQTQAGIEEKVVQFTVDGCRLTGNLLTVRNHADTGAVFVHGYSGNRSGPNGLITFMARRLAHAGTPSLRFDLRGRGESQGEGLETTLPTMASDVAGAAEFIREQCAVRNVLLIGICSGGNVAIGTLPRIPSAAGLVLLSVYPFSDGDSFGRDVDRTLHFARQYWQKALHIETWKRFFRGDVRISQVLNVLFGHFVNKRGAKEGDEGAPPATAVPQQQQKAPPKKHLANLQRGIPALMLYGTADPETKAARAYFESFAQEHRLPLEFVEIAGANHNFSSPEWAKQVADLAAEFRSKIDCSQ